EIGQIHEHRRLFGDQRVAVADRRHLAHRVDRQVRRLALLARLEVERVQVVVDAELLEQGARAAGAALRCVEKGDAWCRAHGGCSRGAMDQSCDWWQTASILCPSGPITK